MRGEARKKYTTSSLNDQMNPNRQKLSEQHKQLGITGPCSTSTFFLGKELFYWVSAQPPSLVIKIRSDNAEDNDILLKNRLGVPFTVRRELNSFEVISCFMDKTFNTCIELGIVPLPLGWNWLWWILHWTRVIFEATNPYPLPFFSHPPF